MWQQRSIKALRRTTLRDSLIYLEVPGQLGLHRVHISKEKLNLPLLASWKIAANCPKTVLLTWILFRAWWSSMFNFCFLLLGWGGGWLRRHSTFFYHRSGKSSFFEQLSISQQAWIHNATKQTQTFNINSDHSNLHAKSPVLGTSVPTKYSTTVLKSSCTLSGMTRAGAMVHGDFQDYLMSKHFREPAAN